MKSNFVQINLNYLRRLYDFLFGMTDEALEDFDINSIDRRKLLLKEMEATFARFWPISRSNIVDGLEFILSDVNNNELW